MVTVFLFQLPTGHTHVAGELVSAVNACTSLCSPSNKAGVFATLRQPSPDYLVTGLFVHVHPFKAEYQLT